MNPYSLDSIQDATRKWVALGRLSTDAQMAIGHDAVARLTTCTTPADFLVVFTGAASRACRVNMETLAQSLTLAGEQLENAVEAAAILQPAEFTLFGPSRTGSRPFEVLPPLRTPWDPKTSTVTAQPLHVADGGGSGALGGQYGEPRWPTPMPQAI